MMNITQINPRYKAALALVILAAILVVTAILTNRGDFTSAALVIAALACFLTGIFFVTLSGSDPLDLRYLSLLPVQGSISMARICADLGAQGNAHLIPGGRDGRDHPMLLVPAAEYSGMPLLTEPFVAGADMAGILIEPSCAPLLRLLRGQQHLAIPHDQAGLQNLIRELAVDVLEVAVRTSASVESGVITVDMEDYRLIDGCRAMVAESQKCCITSPCPVCSLFAAACAESTGKVVRIERCSPDMKKSDVTAIFTVLDE
jgi:hypothetical protein